MAKLFDVANAFYSVKEQSVSKFYDSENPKIGDLALQMVVENHISVVWGQDGEVILAPSGGVAPGFTYTTKIFNHVYHGIVIKDYIERTKSQTSMMHVEFEGTYVCTAHTGFVDDVMTSVATLEVSQVPDMSIELSDALDQ
eukprot:7275318-Karenia_brevis.AAC.1